MKQKSFILASFILGIFLTTSCVFSGPSLKGNGDVVEENRKVGSFDEIKVSRGINVYISQGEKTKVVVEADENLLEAIITKMDGNTLKITTDANIRKSKSKKVFVTCPNISVIKSYAGSNVYSENTIASKNLEISASAGSNIKLEVDAGELYVTSSAGSNIKLEGTAEIFKGKSSAGSNIKAEDLFTNDCLARTSSGANIWISAKNNFEGHASSGGNVFYSGNPKTTDINKSSGGNVIKN